MVWGEFRQGNKIKSMHVVVFDPYSCPKCGKVESGSAEQFFEFLVCPDCFEMYREQLMPELERKIREYFDKGK